MTKNRSIKKNYIFNLIYNLTNLLVPLLIAPYLSRILEVDGVGIKSYTLSIVSNFILFANLGIAEYGQREVSRNRDNKYESSKKLYEIGLLRSITTLVVLLVYIITFVLPVLNTDYNYIYVILIINIVANMLDFSWFLQGIEDFKSISVVQVISKIFMTIMTFAFVNNKNDLGIAILINSLTLLINSILPITIIARHTVKVKMKELNIFKHFKECLLYFVPAIAVQIYTVLDKTMIGIITNSNYENGYYEQADKIVKLLITVVTTANAIMRSRISYLYKENKMEEIKRLTQKSISLSLIISIPITFGIIAVSDIFVPIFFGDGYEKTIIILNILAPLSIIIGLSGVVGSHYYTPMGKRKQSNKYLIIGSIINLIINLLLIKQLGSIGAAISSVIAELIITMLYIIKADNALFTVRTILKASYKYLISGVVMFLIVLSVKTGLGNGIKDLSLLMLLGAITYILMLLISRDEYVYEMLKIIKEKMINGKN